LLLTISLILQPIYSKEYLITIIAWCFYENDSNNNKILGRLYNYYAVSDPRGLAPNGWKIPQKGDFNFYRKKPEEFRSKTGWLKGQNG